MTQPRLFLCNGAKNSSSNDDRKILKLNTQGSDANVNVQLENVTQAFLKNLSPRITDLIEIASYLYAADCATSRGKGWKKGKESWERDFQFIIAVREPDFWSKEEVKQKLIQVLNFLSDDKYGFEFQQLNNEQPQQLYLELNEEENLTSKKIDRVLMFSGGLDSLAGAVETASEGNNLILVSHRSVITMDKRLTFSHR